VRKDLPKDFHLEKTEGAMSQGMWAALEAGKGKEADSPLRAPRRSTDLPDALALAQ